MNWERVVFGEARGATYREPRRQQRKKGGERVARVTRQVAVSTGESRCSRSHDHVPGVPQLETQVIQEQNSASIGQRILIPWRGCITRERGIQEIWPAVVQPEACRGQAVGSVDLEWVAGRREYAGQALAITEPAVPTTPLRVFEHLHDLGNHQRTRKGRNHSRRGQSIAVDFRGCTGGVRRPADTLPDHYRERQAWWRDATEVTLYRRVITLTCG